MVELRTLPHDTTAEQAVLGSCLMNRDAIASIADRLRPEDFWDERHGWVYAAIRDLYRRRTPPDLRTVQAELQRRRAGEQTQLEAVGGIPALAALVDAVPTSYHVPHYAQIVREAAAMRDLIDAGRRIAAMGMERQRDALLTVLSDALKLLTDLQARTDVDGGGFRPIGEIYDQILSELTADEERQPAVPTGLLDYDRLTGGLWPGELVVIAAPPGHGKTSLAVQIAASAAQYLAGGGSGVGICSLEMSAEALGVRMLAAATGIDGRSIRERNLPDEDLAVLMQAMGRQAETPLFIADARQTVAEIRASALRFVAQRGPLRVLVVDYLQIVRASDPRQLREAQVSGISQDLKALARELGATVVTPAQVARDVYRSADQEPQLSDLRESAGIEHNADAVMFLVQPGLIDTDAEDRELARCYIKKQRNGPTGAFDLRFDAATTSFRDAAPLYREIQGYAA